MTALNDLVEPLLTDNQDFSQAFITIDRIKGVVEDDPTAPAGPVFKVCEHLMASHAYQKQKQAYFFFRSVARTLRAVAVGSSVRKPNDRHQALALLGSGMLTSCSSLSRAMAEALGTLPLAIDRHPIPTKPGGGALHLESVPLCDTACLADHDARPGQGWRWQGRSMLTPTRRGELLVVKCLRAGEDPASLNREAAWMALLQAWPKFHHRFALPRPLVQGRGFLVRAPWPAKSSPLGTALHPRRYAIAFLAPADYFHYPNESDPDRRLSGDQALEVLGRNAWLMGRLLSKGVAHTAPIPLFHNRAQRHRRQDDGRYRWTHAGRLDRWLASSRHPNFGVSGLRDFEHFTYIAGQTRCRYETIGSHLISLLLVAGSYFRNKAPDRIGYDPSGKPVDARDLFDRRLFQKMIQTIFDAYYQGFSGDACTGKRPVARENFVDRLIEEMGVDRHMEEILRVADQDAMALSMFRSFLRSRGMPAREADQIPKGRDDIPLMTGPHLGGFNQPISLPELIHFAAQGAALCVAGRFEKELKCDA